MRKFRRVAAGLLLLIATAPFGFAQDNEGTRSPQLNEREMLDMFKAQHLATQLELLGGERIKIEQEGNARENLLLSAANDRTWKTRTRWLSESVRDAQQASDAWDKNVVPLETNNEGQTLARNDVLVMAYTAQVERAEIPKLRLLIQESNQSIENIGDIRNDSHAGGLGLIDALIEKLRHATVACIAATRQIERYTSEVGSTVVHGESPGPLAATPKLGAAAAALKNRQLQQGIKELQTRSIRTEHLKPNDHDRFSRVMSGELAVLYKTASYLRSLPETIEGRLGYSKPILLQFTDRAGCGFRAKIHFFDNKGNHVTSVWADGFCKDKRFRFDTVSWVKGPPKGSSFSLGYVYEGKIESKQITGWYSYKEATKSAGDFSFNTTKAFVFSSDNSIVKSGDN